MSLAQKKGCNLHVDRHTDGHLQRGYNPHVQADMYRHRWMNTQPQTHLKMPTPILVGGGGGGGCTMDCKVCLNGIQVCEGVGTCLWHKRRGATYM